MGGVVISAKEQTSLSTEPTFNVHNVDNNVDKNEIPNETQLIKKNNPSTTTTTNKGSYLFLVRRNVRIFISRRTT